jgi:hypothetical protein
MNTLRQEEGRTYSERMFGENIFLILPQFYMYVSTQSLVAMVDDKQIYWHRRSNQTASTTHVPPMTATVKVQQNAENTAQ